VNALGQPIDGKGPVKSVLAKKMPLPLIALELKKLELQSAVLDGEIVVLDAEDVPRFELLQRFQRDRSGALMYLVFDLLYLNGEDLMGLPLVRRREILKKLLPKEGPIRFSEAIEGRGKRILSCGTGARPGGDDGEKKAGICRGVGRRTGSKSRPECSKRP
jgi:hypothetical protein